MLPNQDWNEIFLQGLVGLGLVGYNTVKTLIDRFDANVIMDYAEYFPNLSLIENGTIENQCARVYTVDISSRRFYLLNGPQPRQDELSSLFLQKFIIDFKRWHKDNPIDIYISFGAFITSMIGPERFKQEGNISSEEIADKLIQEEIKKPRNLFVATCGGMDFEEFSSEIVHPADVVVRETQGYISGLNGVLPALIGERLKIKTATIMVETTGAEISRSTSSTPVLAQFLGLLATRKGLQFLDRLFDIGLDLDTKIDGVIEELLPVARQDIIDTLESGESEFKRDKDTDFRDKMYV
ncbi:MAG: PAC2 family protein [Candidatus Hodarchaeales archaeon]|jgi:proteasome assembly chaperone (PAC2) family protein